MEFSANKILRPLKTKLLKGSRIKRPWPKRSLNAQSHLQSPRLKSRQLPQYRFLPFHPKLIASVESGITTASFRFLPQPFYPKPGDLFYAHCKGKARPGTYRCISRTKLTLKAVRDRYWNEIGMRSPDDYEMLMKAIHSRDSLDYEKRGILFTWQPA